LPEIGRYVKGPDIAGKADYISCAVENGRTASSQLAVRLHAPAKSSIQLAVQVVGNLAHDLFAFDFNNQ